MQVTLTYLFLAGQRRGTKKNITDYHVFLQLPPSHPIPSTNSNLPPASRPSVHFPKPQSTKSRDWQSRFREPNPRPDLFVKYILAPTVYAIHLRKLFLGDPVQFPRWRNPPIPPNEEKQTNKKGPFPPSREKSHSGRANRVFSPSAAPLRTKGREGCEH